jgi:hypothetical protein
MIKMIYEPPMAIDLNPGMANQSNINCTPCTNGASNADGCAVGANFSLPHCTQGSQAGAACISGQAQTW